MIPATKFGNPFILEFLIWAIARLKCAQDRFNSLFSAEFAGVLSGHRVTKTQLLRVQIYTRAQQPSAAERSVFSTLIAPET